jgi:hypothetical protein
MVIKNVYANEEDKREEIHLYAQESETVCLWWRQDD